MTRVEKLLCELIALPSVNPAFLPPRHPNAGEQRMADYLAAWSANAGLDVDFQRVTKDRRNILCRLLPTGTIQHRVLLAPHLDTVDATASGQLRPVRKAGRIYGRGACDTKGSVAAMLDALAEVARVGRRPHHTEVILAGLVDEENEQAGARVLAASGMKADLAVVGEPTRLHLVTAHKGNIWLRVRTRGRCAHGATPDRGENAIDAMAHVVQLIETRYRALLKRRGHRLLGSPSASVGRIRGGIQANIVPDVCEIDVDRRTIPGETDRKIRSELKALLRDSGCRVTVESVKSVACPPLETDPTAPFVHAMLRIVGQPGGEGVPFFCDAAVLAGGGIPSVVFGPGDIAQAHTSDEWISHKQLERAQALFVRYIRALP